MKKLLISAVILLLSHPSYSQDASEPIINKIALQLHAEQWLTTKTALVTVGINAAVSAAGIEGIQNQVMQKLAQLANAEWHILNFDRQQDPSGLESVQITAEARVAQQDLSAIRDKAKSISKAGETYTISNVQFSPSAEEIQQANVALRANIYNQVKTEIESVNKNYVDQSFYLHQIDFTNNVAPMPMRTSFVKVAENVAKPPLMVGNKAELNAYVVLAANPPNMPKPVSASPKT